MVLLHVKFVTQHTNGTLTANCDEMDKLVCDSWMPIFQMYRSSEPPSWDAFHARFGAYCEGNTDMQLPALTGELLAKVLKRMRSKSAAGADGWQVRELKLLPIGVRERLACMLSIIEDNGVWPEALTQGLVTLISKGEGTAPTKLRPIGIMSVVYRLWAAVRVGDVMKWQDSWISDELHGFRRSHGAEDVWWTQALAIEDALLQGSSLYGLSLDYGKCFDRIPFHIVLELARVRGMSPRLLVPLKSLYANLTRRFRFGRALGREFKSTNGIIQGCPLSVVLLNLLVDVWAKSLKCEVPAAMPCGYADDTGMTSLEAASVQSTMDLTGTFATLTGQCLNAKKSHYWSTGSADDCELLSVHLHGEAATRSDGGRMLGAHVAYRRNVKNDLVLQRVSRGITVAERIRWAPLPMRARVQLLTSLVLPSTMYGFSVGCMTVQSMNSLTSAIMRAAWGTKRSLRSKEIVLSLLAPGHLVDPRQAGVYQCLCTLRQFVSKRPDLRDMLLRCWRAHVEGGSAPGPVGLVFKAVAQIGWQWNCFDHFSRPGRSPLPLCGGPDSWWRHELRDGLQLARWAVAASQRLDMAGLEAPQGIDRSATLAFLNGRIRPGDAGILRSILSGSLRLQKRLFDAGLLQSPVCPFCGLANETVEHCFWDCPRWDSLRMAFGPPMARLHLQWPACTKECGLFLEDSRVIGLSVQLECEERMLADVDGVFGCSACRASVLACGDGSLQRLWTDGACKNNQDQRFRRAGCGIFYASSHPLNYSCLLPGLVQSSQRAELFAVLLACLRDPRPLDIRTDSEYVRNGVASWQGWFASGWEGEHGDLWGMLATELNTREHPVTVVRVKGHARIIDVQRSRTTLLDKEGNDGADELAVAGAALHAVNQDIVTMGSARKDLAKIVHDMFITIVKARQVQEHCLNHVSQDDVGDRGSDPGDCLADSMDPDFAYGEEVANASDIALGSCMGGSIASVDSGVASSGTALLHVSGTEPLCHGCLNDECDEGAGTYHVAVN